MAGREALHGVWRSESRTPFSRASCSRVTGMKEPMPHTTKTLEGVSDHRRGGLSYAVAMRRSLASLDPDEACQNDRRM